MYSSLNHPVNDHVTLTAAAGTAAAATGAWNSVSLMWQVRWSFPGSSSSRSACIPPVICSAIARISVTWAVPSVAFPFTSFNCHCTAKGEMMLAQCMEEGLCISAWWRGCASMHGGGAMHQCMAARLCISAWRGAVRQGMEAGLCASCQFNILLLALKWISDCFCSSSLHPAQGGLLLGRLLVKPEQGHGRPRAGLCMNSICAFDR